MLFAVLLVAVCGVFSVMAHFYTYVNAHRLDKMDANDHNGGQRSSSDDDDDDDDHNGCAETLDKKKPDLEPSTRL